MPTLPFAGARDVVAELRLVLERAERVLMIRLSRYTAARRSWGTARRWSSSDLTSLLARVQAEAVRTSDQLPADDHLVDKAVIAASRWLDGDLLADAQTVWLAERACHQAIWRSTVMGADRAA